MDYPYNLSQIPYREGRGCEGNRNGRESKRNRGVLQDAARGQPSGRVRSAAGEEGDRATPPAGTAAPTECAALSELLVE